VTTRREIVRAGAGLAAIIAAGKAPAALIRSMLGLRGAMMSGGGGGRFREVEWLGTNYQVQSARTKPHGAFVLSDLSGLVMSRVKVSAKCVYRGNDQLGFKFLCGCERNDNESGNFKIMTNGVNTGWRITNNEDIGVHFSPNEPLNIVFDGPNKAFTQNGVEKILTSSFSTNTSNRRFGIGGAEFVVYGSHPHRGERMWRGLLGRMTVVYDGVCVGDFVPVLDTESERYGFFDDVGDKFYASATDIPFVIGSTSGSASDAAVK